MLREDASTPDRGPRAYRRSRVALVGVAVVVVVAGLVVARLVAGPWGDPVGDALYAVLAVAALTDRAVSRRSVVRLGSDPVGP